ncbi:hypothetical protein LPJ61_006404, partial [Coemansia biformis]
MVDTQQQQQMPGVRADMSDIVLCEGSGSTKPVLADACKQRIGNVADFNISHDGGWVLAGVTGRGMIGVDVARIHCPEGMAHSEYVGEFEMQVKQSPAILRDFYRIWTAKEAYVKALGTGIADTDLATIDVCLAHNADGVDVQVDGKCAPLEFVSGTLDNCHVYCVAVTPGVT